VEVLGILGVGLADPAAPVVHADDLGFIRGDGCFEGCRVVAGGVAKLDAHIARMARSAAALGIEFEPEAWRALVAQACAAWPTGTEGAMRLLLTRGRGPGQPPTGVVTIKSVPPEYATQRRDGIAVISLARGTAADAFASAPWLLGGVKTLSYAVNMAALREAERLGAVDVIFVSADGWVLEAPTGSVVWYDGRTLWTTPTEGTGILRGTTQQLLFQSATAEGWQTGYATATVEDLHTTEGLWLLSSVRGPVEVVELDGKGRSRTIALTAEIQRLAGFLPAPHRA
jgi:4-amino-4-deoxychorismate lyase